MVGGGNRRDEESLTVSNTNVFAALDSLRKKKKSDKEKGSAKSGKRASKDAGKSKEAEEQPMYWAPAPLTVKSWADVDDEDDDDYYATTAPTQVLWGGSDLNKAEESQKLYSVEESESESESEDELSDGVDDDVEEEPGYETDVQEPLESIVKKTVEVLPAPKETEKQLSKKERRKKELAELEAILADFGVNPKENAEDEPSDASKERKNSQLNGDVEKKENASAESKSAKKKKKKDKASKEVKEPQELPNGSDAPSEHMETAVAKMVEENASGVDVKERLKKVTWAKKKKTNKEMDAAAKAAAVEAAARSARLAAAKKKEKKEKNHYNQQPLW